MGNQYIFLEWFFKIILCLILVGALGYNREKKGMIVGIRTHVVVGLGALLIQLVSLEYNRMNPGVGDIHRLPAQFLSGIGFLGAGTILKDDKNIKGLTTAGTLFFSACVGIAVGSGLYILSALITFFLYLFLTDIFRIKKLIAKNKNCRITLAIETSGIYKNSHKAIKTTISNIGADIYSIQVTQVSNDKSKVIFKLNVDDEVDINEILNELAAIESVIKTQVIHRV